MVLLLDNDQDRCQMMAQRLRSHGFAVVAVTAGEALLACRIYPGPIDVLVTDVDLPGIRADELARQARLIRPSMQTVFLGDTPRKTGLDAGPAIAGTYLPKPCAVDRLANVLHTVTT